MARLKSVRGPKRLSKNVEIAQEYHRQNVNKLLITIRLPSDKLRGVGQNSIQVSSYSTHNPHQSVEMDPSAHYFQQLSRSSILPEPYDFDAGEFAELETELNQALNQPQQERRRSSHSRGVDIVEALKASPKRKNSDSKGDETSEMQPTKPISQPLPRPATPTKRRKTTKRPTISPRQQPTFKPVPANIVPILESELPHIRAGEDDDDDGVNIESIIVSLRDSLGGTKIKLPVRSRFCSHFDCFDYENFCLFYRIPASVKDITRKSLIQHKYNEMARRSSSTQTSSQQSQNQSMPQTTYQQLMPYQTNFGSGTDHTSPMVIQQLRLAPYVKVVDNPMPGHNYTSKFVTPGYETCPFYSCPICSTKFPLNALQISDAFNYFVKTTAPSVESVELVGSEKYRAIGESESQLNTKNAVTGGTQVLQISSDDEEGDEKERTESATRQKMKLDNFVNGSLDPNVFASASNLFHQNNNSDYQGYTRDDPIVLD
ncbi:hypothetical protein KGF57_002941 [Candida theae]|uniref:SP-RING-type domain-containing protein n=1 Tax=Candida theae TaxID=1198502 RepID=A0AAD5BDP7_9ASCO|nr:uncharacterized protein KGF57_002941 [Candida theae]KAI5957675.1 hypothetical protein KGF57_002941 [Candida theae]